jgi:hypothetical protein
MESDDLRTVRVYTKKYTSKDKDGNTVEKESQQKQVSLKKEDAFEDGDLVMVLTQDEYDAVVDHAVDIGVTQGFIQDGETAKESFIPAFDFTGI